VPGLRPAGTTGEELASTQVYQFTQDRLRLDHCFLSRMGVVLEADGGYRVSFRADQNPIPVADAMSPVRRADVIGPGGLQTSQLRRNLFRVTVRGYANAAPGTSRPGPVPTAPAVLDIPIEPFFVERGLPFEGLVEGRSEAVRRAFPLVERVEFTFTYR
jgi:hypothetical protein